MPEPVGIAGSERRVGVRGFCYSLRVASWPLVRGTDSQILPSLVAVFFLFEHDLLSSHYC